MRKRISSSSFLFIRGASRYNSQKSAVNGSVMVRYSSSSINEDATDSAPSSELLEDVSSSVVPAS